jgi:RNA polymerase sigma factor (sigma-70 family)
MNIRPNRILRISPDLANLVAEGTDADLLQIIGAERERNREWAEAALMELHRRNVQFLYAVCLRICTLYLADENQVDNLLSRTFYRVFHTAERFVPDKTRCNGDAECLRCAARAWMARKARWLAKDIIERHSRQSLSPLSELDPPDTFGPVDDELPECSGKTAAAIDRLPARERHIVLASYFVQDCETGIPVPPNEHVHVDKYLARRWGTSEDNIRKIRSRALEKLREMLTPATVRPAKTR